MESLGAVTPQISYHLDLIRLDASRADPLYRQLYEQLRDLILAGDIRESSRLPSTRTISKELAISRNTVVSALDQLAAEGLIISRRGAGSRVARVRTGRKFQAAGTPHTEQMPALSPRGMLMTAQPRVRSVPSQMAFHPGSPELDLFPFKAWGASSPGAPVPVVRIFSAITIFLVTLIFAR